jgi:hypothetical protein
VLLYGDVTSKVTPHYEVNVMFLFPESLIYLSYVPFVMQWRKKFTCCSFGPSFIFVLISINFSLVCQSFAPKT